MYRFTVIDPRPQARAEALAKLAAAPTLGVEVTIPELAAGCRLGNIDPQHGPGGRTDTSAIEEALTWPLPPAGVMLATIRPDTDAFGAMAVLAHRAEGQPVGPEMLQRVSEIGLADRSAPSAPNADEDYVSPLQALHAVVADHHTTVDYRVAQVAQYIRHGDFPARQEYAQRVLLDRGELASIGDVVTVVADGAIAVVESPSRFAVQAAYRVADVVVAVNPSHRVQGGEPHRKVTVCQSRTGLVDLAAVVAQLCAWEPGWGGSPTIVGSPQGVPCVTTTDNVVAVVTRHLV